MPSAPGTARSRSGKQHGYRNAQVSVIAPTGTIGLVMDCDTTGIEPDFALVKFKPAGGGYFKIINRAVPEALRVLGYSESQIAEIEAYAVGHGSQASPGINHTTLKRRASPPRRSRSWRRRCPPPSTSSSPSTSGRSARNSWPSSALPPRSSPTRASIFLSALGFTKREIEAANVHVCGAMTVEGAPHLKAEHYPVFDCANPAGATASAISRSRATSA